MAVFSLDDRKLARKIGQLSFTNPFLESRIELESSILGSAFVPLRKVWSLEDGLMEGNNKNVQRIFKLAEELAAKARTKLHSGFSWADDEADVYKELILYLLFYRYEEAFYKYILATMAGDDTCQLPDFDAFRKDVNYFLQFDGVVIDGNLEPEYLFALFFSLRRAFHFTFRHILGGSMAAARLRSSVWQSIVTHDMRRYRRSLYTRMHKLSTFITGPSGTGKDLVASAIGLSRFIPFNSRTGAFEQDFRDTFHPLNLSALSPTLIEAELFGYAKGAFTGAANDSAGFLEDKGPAHTVFLDEIGEVTLAIQVKLLRLLQSGEFHRLGDRKPRQFNGKIITATNRDMATLLEDGCFRMDLYYRLCSDLIVTPCLAEQIADSPDELEMMVCHLAKKIAGENECEKLASETLDWIKKSIAPGYSWPGNIRELEQCVRNVLIRGEYNPLKTNCGNKENSLMGIEQGEITADELLVRYCTVVYSNTKSYQETARRLGLDRRTVKAKVDEKLLKELISNKG